MRKLTRPTIKISELKDKSIKAISPNIEKTKATISIRLNEILFSDANKNAQTISVGINKGFIVKSKEELPINKKTNSAIISIKSKIK